MPVANLNAIVVRRVTRQAIYRAAPMMGYAASPVA
jgi:hypothetical protein